MNIFDKVDYEYTCDEAQKFVENLRKKKSELEIQISKLLKQFTLETNIEIDSITAKNVYMESEEKAIKYLVNIEIKL